MTNEQVFRQLQSILERKGHRSSIELVRRFADQQLFNIRITLQLYLDGEAPPENWDYWIGYVEAYQQVLDAVDYIIKHKRSPH